MRYINVYNWYDKFGVRCIKMCYICKKKGGKMYFFQEAISQPLI